jgi:hypothetical protein
MSRALTISALLLTALVAFGLYRLSYAVTRLQDELAEYNHGIYADREAIQVLGAEWSYLTRPEALEELASRNLQLHPLLPDQITMVSKLPDRPPAAEGELQAQPDQAPAEIPLPKSKHGPLLVTPKPTPLAAEIVPVLASNRVAP